MFTIWKMYGFGILFTISIVILIILFIINILTSTKGTWTNYIPLMKKLLLDKPIEPRVVKHEKLQLPKSKSFESNGERECRRVLELIYNKPFPKQRPDFLKNNIISNNNLELDCFNQEVGVGLEYNGRQHYEFTPKFHKTRDSFHNLKYRDDLKKRLCKRFNVLLITVPYTIPVLQIENYIKTILNI